MKMNKIWETFKRHPIYKIGAVYAATAFVIIEFINIVFPALHLPDWSLTLVVLLVIIGFPIALVISWATFPKHGEAQNNSTVDEQHSSKSPLQRISWKRTTISTLVLIFISIVGYLSYNHFFHSYATITDKSIAVLPFKNLSDNKDDEYFTEGMTDEILGDLSKMSGLKVLSRTSTEQYKNTTKTMKEIGLELGVQTLLEGSVHKLGDELRVIVQLIDANSDEHIWAKTYNRQMKDVFALQSDVAQQIASELGNTLLPEEKKRIESKPTNNLKAYDYYLHGIKYLEAFEYDRNTDEGQEAQRMFNAAIELDPKFIEARSALCNTYILFAWFNRESSSYTFNSKAKAEVDTIEEMNIDKPCVHEALGNYTYRIERDYPHALSEYNKARHEDPNNSRVLLAVAYVFRRLALFDSTMIYFNKALERNPKSVGTYYDMVETDLLRRNPDEALSTINKAIILEPENAKLYKEKAEIFIKLNVDLKEAKRILDSAKTLVDPLKLEDDYNYIDYLQGNYLSLIKKLLMNPDSIDFEQYDITINSLNIALIYYYEGNIMDATKYFSRARDTILSKIKNTPEDFRLFGALGIAYAGLGDKESAINNGNLERDMMPPSKDALLAVNAIENLALIYTLLGNQDEAIALLEQEMKMPKGWDCTNTVPMLKIYPKWIALRNNPGFKKLIGEVP